MDDSAVSGRDYLPRAGTFSFSPGQTSKRLTVPLRTGEKDGLPRRFVLALYRPMQAVLNQVEAEAIWTIASPQSPPSIQAVSIVDSTLQFRYSTTPGRFYRVESTAQLGVSDWATNGSFVLATDVFMNFIDLMAATNNASYYRVVIKP